MDMQPRSHFAVVSQLYNDAQSVLLTARRSTSWGFGANDALLVRYAGNLGKLDNGDSIGLSAVASAFLRQVSSSEWAIRSYLTNGHGGNLEEEGRRLMAQKLMDIAAAVGVATTLCPPTDLTASGIFQALLQLLESTTATDTPTLSPSIFNKNKSISKHVTTVPSLYSLTPFHTEFLQLCLLTSHYRFAQRFLHSHPLSHTQPFLLLSSCVSPISYLLRYHYYSGLVHMGCSDWNAALSSFQLCLTVPCFQQQVISDIMIAARKKSLLIQCLLLENMSLDNSDVVSGARLKPSMVRENKVLDLPGAVSPAVSQYMASFNSRVGKGARERESSVSKSGEGSDPEKTSQGGGEEQEEAWKQREQEQQHHYGRKSSGDIHPPLRRKLRSNPSLGEGGGEESESSPSTSTSLPNQKYVKHQDLNQYHELVSSFLSGNSNHFATLMTKMVPLLSQDGNWIIAKQLEGRLAYHAIQQVASVYSVVGIDSLEKKIKEISTSSFVERVENRLVEDTLMGMAANDWEDPLVVRPLSVKIDHLTQMVIFVKDDGNDNNNSYYLSEEQEWMEYNTSKQLESCIALAERVHDLDVKLTSSTKYQQQMKSMMAKGALSTTQSQGMSVVGHAPMDLGVDLS